jgi:hypothetical protein
LYYNELARRNKMIPDPNNTDDQIEHSAVKGGKGLEFLHGSTAGSPEAKKLWEKIDADAHSEDAVAKAQKLAGKKAVGMYEGKPLVPGEAGANQGDFKFLVDKLIATKGFSPEVAGKIAAKVKIAKYG